MKTERTIVVVKDVVLFVGGLTGIAYQQLTGKVHELLLLVFTVMVGLPGLQAMWTLKNSSHIDSPSSSSQQRSPSSEQQNSSPHG